MPFFFALCLFCFLAVLTMLFSVFSLVLEKRMMYGEYTSLDSCKCIHYLIPRWMYNAACTAELLMLGATIIMAFNISHYDTISGDFFVILIAMALASILGEFHGQDIADSMESVEREDNLNLKGGNKNAKRNVWSSHISADCIDYDCA